MRSGNESAAIKALQTVASVEMEYKNHNRKFGTFDELIDAGQIDSRFRGEAPIIDGYVYVLNLNPTARDNQPM